MEVNQGRTTGAFPHCGRVFACDDVLGVTDIRLSTDAYQHIVESGIPFVSASPSGLNWGNKYSFGNTQPYMVTAPVVGCASHPSKFMKANVDNPFYSSEAVGELRPDFDGFSINLCFKFMSQAEYGVIGSTFGNTPTGNGYRGQRIRITVQNHCLAPANSVYTLIDIFVDYAYYRGLGIDLSLPTNPSANTIDLQTNGSSLIVGNINNVHIVGQLPATMFRALSCQASAFFRYEIPRAPNGTHWTAYLSSFTDVYGTTYVEPQFPESINPAIGVNMGGCGIIGVNLKTYWTGRGIVPTGVPGGSGGSRVITTYDNEQTSPLPAMGGANEALVYSRLTERGRAAIAASWPALSIMSRRVGGVLKPIVGHSGVFTENAYGVYEESRTFQIQCPQGATRFVLIALVRTIAGAGVHTVSSTLTNEANTSFQTLFSTTNTAGTSYRYVYLNGTLSIPMRPTAGLVERYSLRLRSQKSVPRATQIVTPYLADGVIAFYLAFYQ